MKSLIALMPLLLGPLLLGTASFAAENEPKNIFNASLTNPDLALAVSHFEETCMPFILHKAELTRELDKRHMWKLMESSGYGLMSSEIKSERVLVAPKREPWKPATQNRHFPKSGRFTVFNGISEQVVESIQTDVILGSPSPPANFIRLIYELETYSLRSDDRLSANVGWNYATINQPALSCEIQLEAPSFSSASFAQDFIEKDDDWQGDNQSWTQCVTDGEGQFKFTVARQEERLTLFVTRNHLHHPKLCSGE